MIEYIKAKLLEDPEKIKLLLEEYEYEHVIVRQNYITFGRSSDSSPKSIVIYLHNNDALIVKDWATNQTKDLFNYILSNRSVSFKDVICRTKALLGISGYIGRDSGVRAPFCGFYSHIKRKQTIEQTVYDESILGRFEVVPNLRFLRDGISLEAQRYFGIRYSVVDQAIAIPIRNEVGELVAVKARINEDPQDGQQKYYYLASGLMSQVLYGYSENYEYLESSEVVYVVESEKTVMAAWSYGNKQFVALGSGSISRKQVQLLLQLNCKKIVLLHDTGYCKESVKRNLDMIKGYSRMKDVELYYWNYFGKGYEDKLSPTDMGQDVFEDILSNQLKLYGGSDEEIKL